MMLQNNLSIAAALPPIFHGERRLGNITNWERSSAANDLMLKAIDYCNILDANPCAVPGMHSNINNPPAPPLSRPHSLT
jgi:hypothetical protein